MVYQSRVDHARFCPRILSLSHNNTHITLRERARVPFFLWSARVPSRSAICVRVCVCVCVFAYVYIYIHAYTHEWCRSRATISLRCACSALLASRSTLRHGGGITRPSARRTAQSLIHGGRLLLYIYIYIYSLNCIHVCRVLYIYQPSRPSAKRAAE
jgi:hypothetical protein